MKLVCHAGLHRAASTSFQAWLEAVRPAWEAERRFLFTDLSSGRQGSAFGALMGTTLATLGPDMAADVVAGALDERAASWEAGLVSDENLLGLLPGLQMPAFAWGERFAVALARLSRSHPVAPVLILRDHAPWLRSLYRIAQFRGDSRSFADFADAAWPEGTSLATTLAALERACAPETLSIVTLDEVEADGGRRLLSGVAERLGLAPTGLPPLPHRNESPARLAGTLRQEAARRGGLLLFEDSVPVQQLIRKLTAPARDRDDIDVAVLADIVRRRTVRSVGDAPFQARLDAALAAFAAGPADGILLTRRDAEAVVADALAGLDLPLTVPDGLAARLAEDRRAAAERHVPQWRT